MDIIYVYLNNVNNKCNYCVRRSTHFYMTKRFKIVYDYNRTLEK